MNERDHTGPGEATDNAVAPDRLAALLDGRLSEQERVDLLRQLAVSPADLAVLAQATAILREVEDQPQSQPTQPRRVAEAAPATSRWTNKRQAISVAAAVVVVAFGAWFVMRSTSPTALGPAHYIASLERPTDPLPQGWEGQPWSRTRGDANGALSPRARGVRLGALLVDLQVAVTTTDTAAVGIAQTIARLAGTMPAGGAISDRYMEIAGRATEPPTSLQPVLDQAASAVRVAAGEQAVDLGSWLETARLAAARRDRSYFQKSATSTMLAQLTGGSEATPQMQTTVEQVRSTVASQSPSWEQLSLDLTLLLATAAQGA
jgi:hypothetical protein